VDMQKLPNTVCSKTGFMKHIHFCRAYNKTNMYCRFQDDTELSPLIIHTSPSALCNVKTLGNRSRYRPLQQSICA